MLKWIIIIWPTGIEAWDLKESVEIIASTSPLFSIEILNLISAEGESKSILIFFSGSSFSIKDSFKKGLFSTGSELCKGDFFSFNVSNILPKLGLFLSLYASPSNALSKFTQNSEKFVLDHSKCTDLNSSV